MRLAVGAGLPGARVEWMKACCEITSMSAAAPYFTAFYPASSGITYSNIPTRTNQGVSEGQYSLSRRLASIQLQGSGNFGSTCSPLVVSGAFSRTPVYVTHVADLQCLLTQFLPDCTRHQRRSLLMLRVAGILIEIVSVLVPIEPPEIWHSFDAPEGISLCLDRKNPTLGYALQSTGYFWRILLLYSISVACCMPLH